MTGAVSLIKRHIEKHFEKLNLYNLYGRVGPFTFYLN
jgi:hypothetical protein